MSGGDGKDHNSGAHDSGGSINGVRLENGNYPTLSLFFVHITIH
ncbi:hypothetical protein ABK675_23280 [Hafnia paralvei]